MKILIVLLCFLLSYLIGAIPNSIIIGRLFFDKNLLNEGSKNAGGTNAGRVLGKKIGVLVIFLDIIKSLIPMLVLICVFTFSSSAINFMNDGNEQIYNNFFKGNGYIQAIECFSPLFTSIGHCYSPFLKFKGGKAVSCYLGYAIGCSYLTLPLLAPIFFILLKIKKYVSLSSMTCGAVFCIFSWIVYFIYFFNHTEYSEGITKYLLFFDYGFEASIFFPVAATLQTGLLFFKHKTNIQRLINHEENKIKWMK